MPRPAHAVLPMNPVGTRSAASELFIREISDAVERVPTPNWFMVPIRCKKKCRLSIGFQSNDTLPTLTGRKIISARTRRFQHLTDPFQAGRARCL